MTTPDSARPGTTVDYDAAVAVWFATHAARGRRPAAARVARVREKLAADGALLAVVDSAEADGVELAAVADLAGTGVVAMALGEPGLATGEGELVPGLLHVSMLFVHPARRRAGAGTAVLEQLADDGWRAGYRQIAVWTRTDDARADAFYRAAGLEPDGATTALDDGSSAHRLTAELAPPVRDVVVDTTGLRLGQLLKLAGLAETGTQARELVVGGDVLVDGERELRRGRQLLDGDVVEVLGLGAVRVRGS